jgi:hypothetical protein
MAKRGRPAEIEVVEKPSKYEVRYENEDSTEVWKYNTKLNPTGPVEVVITYKGDAVKKWGTKLKEAKAIKKATNQMKKIEANQQAKKTGKRGRPKRM